MNEYQDGYLPVTIKATYEYMANLAIGQTEDVVKWILENRDHAIGFMVLGNYEAAGNVVFDTKDIMIARGLLPKRKKDYVETA